MINLGLFSVLTLYLIAALLSRCIWFERFHLWIKPYGVTILGKAIEKSSFFMVSLPSFSFFKRNFWDISLDCRFDYLVV